MKSANQLRIERLEAMLAYRTGQEHISHYLEAEIQALDWAINTLIQHFGECESN